MRIGVNGFEAIVPRFGYDKNGIPNRVGSSEVCFEILLELYRIDKKNDYTIFLPSEPTEDLPRSRKGWHYKIIRSVKLWTIFGLNRTLLREKFDVFYSPTHYAPVWVSYPQVITVLDVSYKYFPELFNKNDLIKLNTWGKYSMKSAKAVITISNSSKNDIIREYHLNADCVKVVHLGVKSGKPTMNFEDLAEKYSIKNPYILFVGTMQPRKNLVRLIEAFSKIKNKPLDLVIIGRRGWDYEEIIKAPGRFGVGDSVLFLENVTDQELPSFYENAKIFVLPSLYEGFGLPILEAMKYGCPVVASNVSSMPEAGGDAALYFDPLDADSIAGKLEKVLSDKDLRASMIRKGHEQVKNFSWKKSAREVLKILEEVGADGK